MAPKTYSRHRSLVVERPDEPVAKRRRIDTTAASTPISKYSAQAAEASSSSPFPSSRPSSPVSSPSRAIWKDATTPPTSPLPPSPRRTTPTRKADPLKEISINTVTLAPTPSLAEKPTLEPEDAKIIPPTPATAPLRPKPKPKPAPKRLVQMTLDLGQKNSLRRRCQLCGMEYSPSVPEDAAVHKKFHAQSVGGVDVSRTFAKEVEGKVCRDTLGGGVLVSVGRSDKVTARRVVERVMEVVEGELGGVGIPVEKLWGTFALESEEKKSGTLASAIKDGKAVLSGEDRYKAFLYIKGLKCVGFCLAERISKAYPVIASNTHPDTRQSTSTTTPASSLATYSSSSISHSSTPQPATMGISRIWVSTSARRSGIATTLLDHARRNFHFGLGEVPKAMVAFSQPTEGGGRLAKRWFGGEGGWSVYGG